MKKNVLSIPLGDNRYCVVTTAVVDTRRTVDTVRDHLPEEVDRHLHTDLSDVDFYQPTEPEQLIERLRTADDGEVAEYHRTPEASALSEAEAGYGAALRKVVEWWLRRIEAR